MSNPENKKHDNAPFPTAKPLRLAGEPLWQALQITLITDIIFSFLSATDLKNFRLTNNVCSQVGAITLFKKASRVVLGSIQMETLKKLTEMIRAYSDVPCSKFCIRTGLTKTPTEDATLEEFFHSVSPFITEVEIEKRTGHTIFGQNPNIKNPYPNLKTLKIMYKCFVNQDKDDWTKDVEFLANVIAQTTLLDTVAIKSFNYNAGFISEFLSALDSPQGRKIKHLELRGIVESRQLELATSLRFSLDTLKLEFLSLPDVSPDSISSFLESQTNTLQELKIGSFPAQSNTGISFPRMNALKVLKFYCKFSWGIKFSNILFAQQFPKLKQLTWNIHCRFFNRSSWDQPPCNTLTTLELPIDLRIHYEYVDFGEMIQTASRVFPNTKKLRIPAWKGSIRMLDIHMRNLEELTLSKGNQSNCLEALTGYTNSELAWIEKHLEDYEELVFQKRHRGPQDFLHKIKVLKIELELERDFDLVYYLGLKKLRSLQCLDLRRGEPSINPNKVNKQTLVKMREQFEVLILEADIIRGKQTKQWKCERSVDCLGKFFA